MSLPNEHRSNERRHHLFIVRVWYEPDQTSEGQWRGSVEHVSSGQQMYFVSLADMTDFVALRLHESMGLAPNSTTPIEKN